MLTILGARTRRLWPHLRSQAAAALTAGRRCVLLVPEQYTLQAERDLIRDLSLPGFFDIEVFSLSRFVQRLFLICGSNRVRVDGNGKNIALARALLSCKKDLKYYARSVSRRGFIAQSGEWIADMKRAQITPDKLQTYADSLPESAYAEKMGDLARIYGGYSDILADKFVDGEDVLAAAIDAVPQSKLVQDADVLVYGFDVITDDFARLLCAITASCSASWVYLVMDRQDAPDGDCFAPVRDSAERLRTRLRQAGLRREWLWLDGEPMDAPEDIRALEARLLRPAPAPYQQIPQHITLFEAATPYAEAHYIAQEIVTCARRGVAYGDIAILCGNMAAYASVLDTVLRQYDIPAYIAVKEPLLSHGLVRLLLSAVRAATGGYRAEDMLAAIKSGYAPLSQEEAWQLENYALAYGINGARWREPFARGSEEERESPEQARQKLYPILKRLQDGLREARDAAQSLRALMNLLTDCDAYHTLLAQEDALVRAGMADEAVRTRQVWTRLLALLEQMHEIAGGARIPGSTVTAWIEAGLMDEGISSLPPSEGCVTVGEIGNLIAFEPRITFACGLHSEGAGAGDHSLLTDEEKSTACADMEAYLGMGEDERDLMNELDIWKVLSSPRDMLYLSHAQANQAGEPLRAAPAIAAIRRIFPGLTVLGTVEGAQGALHPLAPQPTLDAIGTRLRGGDLHGEWLQAFRWLWQQSDYHGEMLALLSAARDEKREEALVPGMARALFTDRVVSISRLESYAACPYQHFVQYGLRPQERKTWATDERDRGVFYHAAMEGFTRALTAHPSWPNITREDCDALMDAAMQPLTEQCREQAIGDSARARAEGRRYIHVCKRVAWAFTKGAAQSSFRPQYGEVAFGYPGGPPPLTLNLSDGTKVSVRGRIDRIDRFDSGESVYLRVVDYKSSAQKLDPARINIGMQLQLLLYLEAALAGDRDALPAGAFYQWMGDPLVDQDKQSMIESELAKRLCLKGVMLSDVQVAQWMDASQPPVSIENVFNKDGSPKKGKLVCTLDELYRLIERAHRTAVRLTEEIRGGGINAAPVCERREAISCQRCAFAGVCRRDPRNPAFDRALSDASLENLIKKSPNST